MMFLNRTAQPISAQGIFWFTMFVVLLAIPFLSYFRIPVPLGVGAILFLGFSYWIFSFRRNLTPIRSRQSHKHSGANRL